MSDKPDISVIVLTYNSSKTIRRTLDSIIQQQTNYTFEILVADDCSQDNTRTLINEYKNIYPLKIIPIFNTFNKGVVKNFFDTFTLCKADYVMCCAGDDWWLPGKVTKQLDFMKKNPDTGLSYTRAKLYLDDKNKFSSNVGFDCTTFEKMLYRGGGAIPTATECFKKSEMEKYLNEIQPLTHNWLMEDYPAWLWFAKNSKIVFLNDVTAVYRIVKKSVSHSNNLETNYKFFQNSLEVQIFYSNLYNVPFSINKEDFDFNFYFAQLNNAGWSKVITKKVKELYKLKHNKTVKDFIKFIAVHNVVIYKILMKLYRIIG